MRCGIKLTTVLDSYIARLHVDIGVGQINPISAQPPLVKCSHKGNLAWQCADNMSHAYKFNSKSL